MPEVYILHFDRPYWKTCQHYAGYTKGLATERLQKHLSGNGSKICRYAVEHGINFQIVHTERFDTIASARAREIKLKKEAKLKTHCYICRKVAASD